MKKHRRYSIEMLCLSALMCALLILSAVLFRFPLPGTDVLFTLQIMAVLMCGLLLPLKYALYSVLGYIALGLLGLPVFSSVCGPGAIITPSFGFLLGFPAAVGVEHILLKRMKSKKSRDFVAALCGIFAMYIVALSYIALLKGLWLRETVAFGELFILYGFSFLPMDIIKAILAALIAPRLRKALSGR